MVTKTLKFEDIVDSPFVNVSVVITGDPNPDGSIPIETRGLGTVTQDVAYSMQADVNIKSKLARNKAPVNKSI